MASGNDNGGHNDRRSGDGADVAWRKVIEERMNDLDARLETLRRGHDKFDATLTDVSGVTHAMKHDLANNTMATKGTASSIKKIHEAVDDLKKTRDEDKKERDEDRKTLKAAVDNSAQAVVLMQNLTALNRVAEMTKKWLVPIVTSVAGLIIAAKSILR